MINAAGYKYPIVADSHTWRFHRSKSPELQSGDIECRAIRRQDPFWDWRGLGRDNFHLLRPIAQSLRQRPASKSQEARFQRMLLAQRRAIELKVLAFNFPMKFLSMASDAKHGFEALSRSIFDKGSGKGIA